QAFVLFGDSIREGLDDKRQQLHRIEAMASTAAQTEQGDLDLGGPSNEDSQQNIAFDDEKQEALRQEIAALPAQENNTAEDHPLMWNIEFAEIFVEKGGFDVIIGNPPYVRQEDIGDPLGLLDPDAYKEKLNQMVRMDYPDHFKGDVSISGRSDL